MPIITIKGINQEKVNYSKMISELANKLNEKTGLEKNRIYITWNNFEPDKCYREKFSKTKDIKDFGFIANINLSVKNGKDFAKKLALALAQSLSELTGINEKNCLVYFHLIEEESIFINGEFK